MTAASCPHCGTPGAAFVSHVCLTPGEMVGPMKVIHPGTSVIAPGLSVSFPIGGTSIHTPGGHL